MVYTQLVVFRVGGEEYAIPIEMVREIINYMPVTKLPDTPAYLEGVINVRGIIVPVVNFARKIGLAAEPVTRQIIIVETQGKEVGLTVETVTEVLQAAKDNVSDVESVGPGSNGPTKVYKVNNRILILLDIEKVILGPAA